jgi:hypothetical protein
MSNLVFLWWTDHCHKPWRIIRCLFLRAAVCVSWGTLIFNLREFPRILPNFHWSLPPRDFCRLGNKACASCAAGLSSCSKDVCVGSSSGTAGVAERKECACQCLPHLPVFREDLHICIDDIHGKTLKLYHQPSRLSSFVHTFQNVILDVTNHHTSCVNTNRYIFLKT